MIDCFGFPTYAQRVHQRLVFWNSIHQEVASDSFCFSFCNVKTIKNLEYDISLERLKVKENTNSLEARSLSNFLYLYLASIGIYFLTFGSLLKNCNHKGLGIYYLLSAFIFGISGTLISVLIRIELYSSGNRIISPENQNFYNISITLHGFLMIFFLVMPGLFGGFGNYFVPIFQGSPEVVYPRVNNFSILILSLSYLFLILSLISEFGGGTGWTLYPPLSTSFMSLSPSSTAFMVFGLLMSGISSCLTSLNFWTTILNLRSYYLTLKTIPLFPWALFITGGMLLLTLPILTGALLMVLADLHSNTLFFDPIFGGDPIFYQHLFWFFGHPEVYILIIPEIHSSFGLPGVSLLFILYFVLLMKSHLQSYPCPLQINSFWWRFHSFKHGLWWWKGILEVGIVFLF